MASFIPKIGKLRPICHMSFILKTFQKLHDILVRVALTTRPLHQDEYAYSVGMSTQTVLNLVTEKAEYAYKNTLYWLQSVQNDGETFDNKRILGLVAEDEKSTFDGQAQSEDLMN